MTGTLASLLIRSIRPLPPRGTMTSTYCGMVINCPTAARSAVATTCTAAAGNPAACKPCSQALGNGAVGSQSLGAAAQDGGIAGFEAQAGRLHGHIGPRLINDADHTQRHSHATHLDAAGHASHIGDTAHRVRQRSDLPQAFQHGVDARRGQLQAIQQRRLQCIGAALFHIAACWPRSGCPAHHRGHRGPPAAHDCAPRSTKPPPRATPRVRRYPARPCTDQRPLRTNSD